eukprot:SAG11_NODE_3_length_39220_cov_67.005828_14_plen_831_part_00
MGSDPGLSWWRLSIEPKQSPGLLKNVAAGLGVSYAEIELGSWQLPPVPPAKQCEIREGVHWGGNRIAIDPWEAHTFKGINASQCCEQCRGQVGPACVAFTLTGAGKDTKCTLLSSRLPNDDQPAKTGETVVSGAPVRRQTRVTMQASCSTPAAGAKRVPLSYLTFLSLVLKTDDDEKQVYSATLKADTLQINGVGQIAAQLWGVTAYETHGDYFWQEPDLGGAWLTKWGVDAVGVGNMGYPLPPGCSYNSTACPVAVSGHPGDKRDAARCPGPKFDEAEIRRWYDDMGPAGAYRWFWQYPSMQSGQNKQMFGNLLKTVRAGGAEPFVYLEYSLPGDMSGCGKEAQPDIQAGPPQNATLWGVAAAAYLNLARTADPGLHLAHLTNEPNSNWFRHSQHMVSDYAAFFAEAAAAIKREVPGMKLGGPVLCWPVSESWGWVPALIDSSFPSGGLDFVDFHAYGYPDNSDADPEGLNIVGQAHAIASYASVKHGRAIPTALTETNWGFHNLTDWLSHSRHMQVRTLPIARQILSMAQHPDKCIIRHMHDMNANAGGIFSFRSNPANPTMLLHKLLKPFRGTRLATSVVSGSITAGALAMQQLILEVAGDVGTGRYAIVIAIFASSPAELALNISHLGVVTDASQSTVLDLLSLRKEAIPCQTMVSGHCVKMQVPLPAQSIRVLEVIAKTSPQPCKVVQLEHFVANTTFIGLANYTPSCSQQPPLCREHLPPPCVNLNSEQTTECTNRTTPLNLTLTFPLLNSSASPTAMLVRLGMLAKKYHSPGPPPQNSWYLNTDIGRWRQDTCDGQSVKFDGAAFIELRLIGRSAILQPWAAT